MVGFAIAIIVYIFMFPLLISYAERSSGYGASFIMRFVKTLSQGLNRAIKDVEQSQIDELKKAIRRENFLASECHAILDGILSHLYTVAEENEQRSELSFKLLLKSNLTIILSILFEEGGELNRYRAGVFYRDEKNPLNLEYFEGVSKSNQDKYSEDPLPINGSIGRYSKKLWTGLRLSDSLKSRIGTLH